jgi:peptidoglycan/xylan/chitin deacetylase (PgdA/CDA1 family)/uncharacterized caspase-like protein
LKLKKPGKLIIISISVAILIVFTGLIWLLKSPSSSKKASPTQQTIQVENALLKENLLNIVKNYRKIIVLLENDASLDAQQLGPARITGEILFHENQQRLNDLIKQLNGELERASTANFGIVPSDVEQFLNTLEGFAEWHDADKLVFRDSVDQIAESLRGLPGSQKPKMDLQDRLESDRKALLEIQTLYEKELEKIFARFETRGMIVRREAWEQYVAYLKTKFKRDDILKEYSNLFPSLAKEADKKTEKQSLSRGMTGTRFPPKTLVLTFDDGPHPIYTDRIMEILKKYQVKAVFFEVGQNLGSFRRDNTIEHTRAAAASERAIKSGFSLGNHSHTHPFLPKLADKELLDEIERPDQLLQAITQTPITLFRPPYGAQNEKLLAALQDHHLKSILWNVDSRDWADPIPKSIANRVLREVFDQDRGIILFHDIHQRTIEALPLVLETLKKDGYHFLTWNGKDFIDETPPEPSASPQPAITALYRESWAVIIGIDDYRSWPKLSYAVNDAKGIRELLIRKYKFKPECIITLLNEEATREKILSALGDTMGNPEKVKRDDRVFIFFAGHGITRKLSSGRDLGYIVPVEADVENYQGRSISMTNFQDISEAIFAKHVLFVMDSCYSGLALMRGSGNLRTDNYLREISRRISRQMLTAGGANEQVADNGPNGHSVFTWTLMQGLEGRADLNGDGFITASELAAYVGPSVSALSKQTPAFGSLPGSEGGEFIFEPKQENEFLSELSTQLDKEAIEINNQLEQIRKQIAEKSLRNEKLRQRLAYAQSLNKQLDVKTEKGQDPSMGINIRRHMERGDALFKEKKYAEALKEFIAVVQLDEFNALAANNAGFMYYKLEQYEEAANWFEKTIVLDPHRAIAYVNLGDAYLKLDRKPEAKKAFQQYLQISPNSKNAEDIKKKLALLD